jgi:hypothetical protein
MFVVTTRQAIDPQQTPAALAPVRDGAVLVRGREEKPRAVRQDQVLLAERPWWHVVLH